MKNQPVIEACRNFSFRNTPETLRYFYHPDHIGSTSWVTDSAKNGIQYCEYLPFGEPFIDQRSTTWNSRYTFSGKERDNETGYSYFGARYYNSDISIWLSVDPLSDKYPNLSSYAYCANNPIVLVDPDGREWEIDGILYKPGQACPEDVAQNTKDKWDAMNKIYSVENGKKVIDEMNVEGVMYKVSSESYTGEENASGGYLSNNDGTGGTLYLNGKNSDVSVLSHEMFHGYQDLNGQGGASIQNEIEARMFSTSVCTKAGVPYFSQLKPLEGNIPEVFEYNAKKLQSEYSDFRMNYLIITFKNHYSGYEELPRKTSNQKSLIKSFYPL